MMTHPPITDPRRLLKAKYDPSIKCARHLSRPLDPTTRRDTIEKIITVLKRYDFDAIAFRGLSGALVAPTVAMLMDKTILAVRKGERCYSGLTIEGDYNAKRYVILDDMVSSGDTVKDIFCQIESTIPEAHCIGMVLYLSLRAEPSTIFSSRGDDVPVGVDERGIRRVVRPLA